MQISQDTSEKLSALYAELQKEDDFMKRLDIEADIEDLEYKAGIREQRKTGGSYFECVGCGS